MIVNFETQKGRFAFVSLPNNTFNVDIRSLGQYNIVYFEPSNKETEFTAVSDYKEKVSIIGFVKDLAEEQWEEVVDEFVDYENGTLDVQFFGYNNYQNKEFEQNWDFKTATESGKSLTESLDVYVEGDWDWLHNMGYGIDEQYPELVDRTSNWLLIRYDN
jgi:hypothetical protein